MRVLAALTANRDPAFADVPTARKQGLGRAMGALVSSDLQDGREPRIAAGCERLEARTAFLPKAELRP